MLRVLLLTLILILSTTDARKANEAYRNGNYAEAEILYRQAIEQEPDNPKLYFNLGNALARQGKSEEAARYFEQFKSMVDTPEEQAWANYNIGNIFSNREEWKQAAGYYRQALRYDSKDFDAKHNYELALQKQQEQEENQQQEQDSQQQQQNRDQQQQQSQSEQNQNQQQNQQDQQNSQQNRQQQQPEDISPMSREEAESILKALEQREKELLKEFKKPKSESSPKTNEKDW